MANVLLGFPNRTDSATLSGGNWQTPLTNLQDRRLSRVARSASPDKAATQFDVDLGVPRKLSLFAIVRHNLGLNARYRIRVAQDAAFQNVLYDTAVLPSQPSVSANFALQQYAVQGRVWPPVWPRLFNTASLDWEDPNWWDGRLPEEDRKGYPGLILSSLAEPVFGRYVRFEFLDEGNIDGYVELGRLFISQAWSPRNNATYGAGIGWEFDTTMDRALDGTAYFDEKAGRRVQTFSLDWLSRDEAFGNVFEMHRAAGIDREMLFVWDRDDPINLIRRSFLGRMRKINPLMLPFLDNYTNAFELEEIT
ncbi:hypothetical protein [Paraburkholderia caribensis]|uniref:hypothetical protein n=1 Tax=Paraburkholderia caribensis TaxID=75105 RepID=UPI0007211275|nr:hypothetical protein [Paraburkholderia caribensis]ALP62826.1 hypothetical protein AN416_09605 [Paraburkholderia caribensis]AUT51943.1 hypothetical protein C2L66_08795 [Paraburkholderia caribensis]